MTQRKHLPLFLMLALLLASGGLRAQAPPIQWQRCLGGTDWDQGLCIIQTRDSNFVITGYAGSSDGDCTSSRGGGDAFVAKLDISGNLIWKECLGGSSNDIFYSIVETSDGGFICTGITQSPNDGDVQGDHGEGPNNTIDFSGDVWVVKLDSSGKIEWQKCYGGYSQDFGQSIIQTSDGGYMIAATTSSSTGDVIGNHMQNSQPNYQTSWDIWMLKLDARGNVSWQKCLGGKGDDRATSVIQTSDGYVISGYTNSTDGDVLGYHSNVVNSSYDIWMLKLDFTGLIMWSHCYGGSGEEISYDLIQTSDKGFAIAGTTNSSDGDVRSFHYPGDKNPDAWILRLDSSGNMVWNKCFGGSGFDEATSIVQTSDGGFVFTGITNSTDGDLASLSLHGGFDVWVVKTSSLGSIEWQEALGGSQNDAANKIIRTSDDGYALTGWTLSNDGNVSGNHKDSAEDIWVVKLKCPMGIRSARLFSSRIINDSLNTTIHLPIYLHHSGTMGDVDMIMHYPSNGSLKYQNGITYNYKSIDVVGSQWAGRAELHFAGADLNSTPDSLIGFVNFVWSPYEFDCDYIDFDSIGTSEALCSGKPLSFQGIIGSYKTCGASSVADNNSNTQFDFSISQNPAEKNIEVTLTVSLFPIRFELFDVLGIMKRGGMAGTTSMKIDVSDLPSGNYYLRINAGNGVPLTKEVIIIK